MQAVAILDENRLTELIVAVFGREQPEVFTAYSDYDEDVEHFQSMEQLRTHLANSRNESEAFCNYAIWFPSTRGHVAKERIKLDPRKCKGHRFRYAIRGWGVIYLQCDLKRKSSIECRIAVTSQKRAVVWQAQSPELRDPLLWNWQAVDRHARRLIRKLKALGG